MPHLTQPDYQKKLEEETRKEREYEESALGRDLSGFEALLCKSTAICMTIFQVYTAYFGIFTAFRQRGLHVLFVVVLCFMIKNVSRKLKTNHIPWYDWILIMAAIFSFGYISVFADVATSRFALVTKLSSVQMAVGVIGILVLFEASRRAIGGAFSVIILLALLYGVYGNYLPGLLRHRGFSLMYLVDSLFFTWDGIFGIPTAASATYIFIFILFAQFLHKIGAGQFFLDLAIGGVGHRTGGPAKVAVLASALMGTITGSATANVAGTGSITIPFMKSLGYRSHFAAAVEAVASTGGQIMPPVMGAAAFVMAEYTGIPYIQIALAATIPAILYFLGVAFQIHFEAARLGLLGLPKEDLPDVKPLLRRGFHYFIPLVIVFYVLMRGYSPLYAGLWAIIVALVVATLKKVSRISPMQILEVFESAAKGVVEVAVACAAAGIVIGVLSVTGLGLRFSSLIITLSGDNVYLALTLTMVVAVILGMGLPVVAAYIIQAALLAPALVSFGIPVLAAHLFCFYFAILSHITPPVAVSAFAAAAIAKAPPVKVALTAMKLGVAAYIVPYIFVFSPALLFRDTPLMIVFSFVTACIGMYGLAIASTGFYIARVHLLVKAVFVIAALLLIYGSLITDLVGMILFFATYLVHKKMSLAKIAQDQAT